MSAFETTSVPICGQIWPQDGLRNSQTGAAHGNRGANTVIGAMPDGQAANGFTVLPARSASTRPGWRGMRGWRPSSRAILEDDRTECASRRGMDRRIPPDHRNGTGESPADPRVLLVKSGWVDGRKPQSGVTWKIRRE